MLLGGDLIHLRDSGMLASVWRRLDSRKEFAFGRRLASVWRMLASKRRLAFSRKLASSM